MPLLIANNATSTLAASATNVATTITVQTGDASLFPSPAAGEYFLATLIDASLNREIVKCTSRTGAALTVVRGQEGTTARAWNAGDRISVQMTAGAFAAIENAPAIADAVVKSTPANADKFGFWDSVTSKFRALTWANIVSALWASPTFTGSVTLPGDPASALQAATKQYVDNVAAGLNPKASVKVATTANITLSGTQTIDGVSVVAGDRVLVKDQSTPAQNGLYVVAAGAWSRSTDMDAWSEVPGANVWVQQGSANADRAWVCTADAGGTLGSTSITWVQFGGTGAYAPLNSPALTGTPTAPTAGGGTNTTQVATTAFVAAAISALSSVYQAAATILAALAGLANASGYLKNDGSGGLSWGTPTSGGMTLLGTLTTTSGTTQSLTGIASGYQQFYIELDGVTGSSNSTLNVALGSGSTSYGTAGVASATANSVPMAGFIIIGNVSSTVAAAKSALASVMASGASGTVTNVSTPTGTAAVATAVRFSWSTGSFTAGTIRIYGVK